MTLAEFLLARLADDEAYARDWIEHDADHDLTRFGTGRILAECEAKRRIVDQHKPVKMPAGWGCPWDGVRGNCDTLRIIALPYAGHPDYQNEWKP